MTAARRCDFGVELEFEPDKVVVALQGDLDAESAPALEAIVSSVTVGRGHVVLDLAELAFIGAAGLGVIAEIASRLRVSSAGLTVRAAGAFTLRLLEISGVGKMVRVESPAATTAPLAAEQPTTRRSSRSGRGSPDQVEELVRIGSTAAAMGVVDGALQLVTALAEATIEGADGVSVSLERHGRISTVAWTNDTVLKMDLHQYQSREGPCLDAATTGRWFHSRSLSDEGRWPTFVPHALEEGIASILSTPLITAKRAVGAVNMYSNTRGAFGEPQLALAALFAEQASGIVTASVVDDDVAERLADALRGREVIAQAQGVLMARTKVSADVAAAVLYRAARSAGVAIRTQAALVVASTTVDGGPQP